MAQLILPVAFGTTAGTVGGFFAAAAGLAIDSYLFARLQGDPDPRQAPRLTSIQGFRGQEGLPVLRLWGKQRIGSQAIWRERKFTEITNTERHSLGKGRTQETTTYSYRISFAVAFCEGGAGTKLLSLEMNGCPVDLEWETNNGGTIKGGGDFEFFPGTESQPVSSIVRERSLRDWVEAGNSEDDFPGVPAYRGLCYMAFRDLNLDTYHNRIPAIRARILRPSLGRAFLFDTESEPREGEENGTSELPAWRTQTQLLTLSPGYGESLYEPSALRGDDGRGNGLNFNARLSATEGDVIPALDRMDSAFPNAQGLNVPVTWFRTPEGEVKPGVEVKNRLLITQPWSVSGVERDSEHALAVTGVGGTPSDSSIFNFVKYLLASGSDVELTCRVLNPDGTSAKEEVIQFGSADVSDFEIDAQESTLVYNGDPDDFGYRRMVLHYAKLLRLARLTSDPQSRRVATLRPNGAQEFEMREPRVSCLWVGDSMKGTTRPRTEIRTRAETAPRTITGFKLAYLNGQPFANGNTGSNAFQNLILAGFIHQRTFTEGREIDGFNRNSLTMISPVSGDRLTAWGLPRARDVSRTNLFLVEYDGAGRARRIWPFTDFRPLQRFERSLNFFAYSPSDLSDPGVNNIGNFDLFPLVKGRTYRWEYIDPSVVETFQGYAFDGAEAMGILLSDAIEAGGLSRSTAGYIAAGDEYHSAQFPETGAIQDRFIYFNMDWVWRETQRIGVRADLPYSDFRGETNYDPDALEFDSGEYGDWLYLTEQDRANGRRSEIASIGADFPRLSDRRLLAWKDMRAWVNMTRGTRRAEQPDGSTPQELPWQGADSFGHPSWLNIFLSCRAVDKATNSPRGDLPPFSNGSRDDLVQNPYFEAAFNAFKGFTRRIYVEGWDARPEEVIRRGDLWADAGRWATSDSLVRRTSPAALSATLLEIMRDSGLDDSRLSADFAESPAPFIGYSAQGGQSGREVIAPLLQAYAQNAFESGGRIVVRPKTANDVIRVDPGDLVPTEDMPEGFLVTHEADSSVQSSLRVSYYAVEGNEIASVPAYLPHRRPGRESSASFSVVMEEAHALAVGRVSLREGEISAERWRLNLLPEHSAIEPSDIIELDNLERSRILVTSVERGDFIQVEGHRAESAIYDFTRIG